MIEVARAVRLKDWRAAESALDAEVYHAAEVATGRAEACQHGRRDPPLPPLAADPLPFIAKEAEESIRLAAEKRKTA
jgi:hypothetical protein